MTHYEELRRQWQESVAATNVEYAKSGIYSQEYKRLHEIEDALYTRTVNADIATHLSPDERSVLTELLKAANGVESSEWKPGINPAEKPYLIVRLFSRTAISTVFGLYKTHFVEPVPVSATVGTAWRLTDFGKMVAEEIEPS